MEAALNEPIQCNSEIEMQLRTTRTARRRGSAEQFVCAIDLGHVLLGRLAEDK